MDKEKSIEMALIFYYADCETTFKKWEETKLKELAEEISKISNLAPIHEPSDSFQKGFFVGMIKNLKPELNYIKPNKENLFEIKGTGKKFTTLQLMATLAYCVNRLSGGQLNEKFDWVRIGKMIAERPVK